MVKNWDVKTLQTEEGRKFKEFVKRNINNPLLRLHWLNRTRNYGLKFYTAFIKIKGLGFLPLHITNMRYNKKLNEIVFLLRQKVILKILYENKNISERYKERILKSLITSKSEKYRGILIYDYESDKTFVFLNENLDDTNPFTLDLGERTLSPYMFNKGKIATTFKYGYTRNPVSPYKGFQLVGYIENTSEFLKKFNKDYLTSIFKVLTNFLHHIEKLKRLGLDIYVGKVNNLLRYYAELIDILEGYFVYDKLVELHGKRFLDLGKKILGLSNNSLRAIAKAEAKFLNEFNRDMLFVSSFSPLPLALEFNDKTFSVKIRRLPRQDFLIEEYKLEQSGVKKVINDLYRAFEPKIEEEVKKIFNSSVKNLGLNPKLKIDWNRINSIYKDIKAKVDNRGYIVYYRDFIYLSHYENVKVFKQLLKEMLFVKHLKENWEELKKTYPQLAQTVENLEKGIFVTLKTTLDLKKEEKFILIANNNFISYEGYDNIGFDTREYHTKAIPTKMWKNFENQWNKNRNMYYPTDRHFMFYYEKTSYHIKENPAFSELLEEAYLIRYGLPMSRRITLRDIYSSRDIYENFEFIAYRGVPNKEGKHLRFQTIHSPQLKDYPLTPEAFLAKVYNKKEMWTWAYRPPVMKNFLFHKVDLIQLLEAINWTFEEWIKYQLSLTIYENIGLLPFLPEKWRYRILKKMAEFFNEMEKYNLYPKKLQKQKFFFLSPQYIAEKIEKAYVHAERYNEDNKNLKLEDFEHLFEGIEERSLQIVDYDLLHKKFPKKEDFYKYLQEIDRKIDEKLNSLTDKELDELMRGYWNGDREEAIREIKNFDSFFFFYLKNDITNILFDESEFTEDYEELIKLIERKEREYIEQEKIKNKQKQQDLNF